jgi:hypothetical protein
MVQFLCVDINVVLLGQAAEARNVDYSVNSLELLLDDPVFDLLFSHQVMVGALELIPIDLADRILGRDCRGDALGKRHEVDSIDSLHPVPVVIAVPAEIAADIGQSEQGDRSHRFKIAHPGQADFERHRHQLFHFLGAQTARLPQNLDHRLDRIGVGFNVEIVE